MDKRRLNRIYGGAAIALLMIAVFFPAMSWGHPAYEVVDAIWYHLGGKEAYEKCRYLEFVWTYEHEGDVKATRSHTWDRYEGDYVLEFTDSKTHDTYKVYFNVNSRKGVAFKNGAAVGEDETAQVLERAYSMFINDTYWLLLPTKLNDPGVRLQFIGHARKAGERDIEEPSAPSWIDVTDEEAVREHNERVKQGSGIEDPQSLLIVLHLWFSKKVGLTPGDEYWLYVTHDGAVVGWRYVLEGGDEGEWVWTEETDCGMGITLPTKRNSADGSGVVVFPNVTFSETMDRGVFEPSPGG